jgi:beta-lactamase regulating signal transducer with metallopeptidase domain
MLQAVLDVALKGSVICASAWGLAWIMRRSSACVRNRVWVFTLASLLVLPLLSFVTPVWQLPLLPSIHQWGGAAGGHLETAPIGTPGLLNGAASAAQLPGVAGGEATEAAFGAHWSHWVLLCLAAGSLVVLLWTLAWHLRVRRIIRQAEPLGGGWSELLQTLSRSFRLHRSVRLLKTPAVKTGITVGTLRPAIILPEHAEDWNEARRRFVIAHELAHIERHDALIEDLATVVTILYWFNPLVWMVLGRLRIERERDCDNAVLRTGAKPSDYAMQLMEIAKDVRGDTAMVWQPARISQDSNLKDRLLHILNPDTRRGSAGRRATLGAALLLMVLILPLSSLGVWKHAAGEWVLPEVALPAKSAMYWSEVVRPETSAAYLVECLLMGSGISAAVDVFGRIVAQEKSERDFYIDENEFNQMGYRYMYAGKTPEAIAIFRMNVVAFSSSWNVYDSLGEAYLLAGQYDLAGSNYKRSLQLGSQNAEKALKNLQYIEQHNASGLQH